MRLAASSAAEVLVVARREPKMALLSHESFMNSAEFMGPAGAEPLSRASAVIYLAAASTVATFADRPWSELDENVTPLMQVAGRIVQENPACRLVFASSGGAIYGDPGCAVPITEDRQCKPISPYGLGKLMAEESLKFFGRTGGLDFRTLRISNPVGYQARSTTQGLVGVAMNAIASGKPLTLFGDGSNVRDLVDADDVADALIMAAQDNSWPGRVWNIGSGSGISNREVLDMVGRVAGKPVPVEHAPARPQDVQAIVLDCSKAERELGWRSIRQLEQTVAKIWQLRSASILGSD